MNVKVQPVVFGGVVWTSREKLGLEPQPTPRQIADKRSLAYVEQLRNVELLDLCAIEGPDEIGVLIELARQANVVLVVAAELLSVRWAVRALAAVGVPVVFHGEEDRPAAVFCDLYGCLKADGCDAHLALDIVELQTTLSAIRAKKRLASTKALLIGDGYPSHSQVANPDSPRIVEDKIGVQIVQRSIDDLRRLFEKADDGEAHAQAQAWLDGAKDVAEEAKCDIVEVAKVYLSMKAMIAEVGADVFTIDCRAWDLWSCEKFHSFYSPCMGMTTLRWEGIPAACEADICAMLSMCALNYVSDLPVFMGNIGRIDRDKNSVQVAGHAAATVNMDGKGDKLEGYRLTDYGGRGGVASYCSMQGGTDITIARFDKNLNHISIAAGKTLPTDRCFEVVVGDVEDFMHRCLTGDHYAVVYGNHLEQVSLLMKMLGVAVLTPDSAKR